MLAKGTLAMSMPSLLMAKEEPTSIVLRLEISSIYPAVVPSLAPVLRSSRFRVERKLPNSEAKPSCSFPAHKIDATVKCERRAASHHPKKGATFLRLPDYFGQLGELRVNMIKYLVVHVGTDARVLAEIRREQESIVRLYH
jgi:hypothetical protein